MFTRYNCRLLALVIVAICSGRLVLADTLRPATTSASLQLSRANLLGLLGGDEWSKDGSLAELLRIGKSAFPMYVEILSDRKTPYIISSRVLYLIRQIPSDRTAFLPFAVRGLLCDDWGMTISSIEFISDLGSAADAPLLLPLMAHVRWEVRINAVRAISRIGTEKEAAWLSVWLHEEGAKEGQRLRDEVSDAINLINRVSPGVDRRAKGAITQ